MVSRAVLILGHLWIHILVQACGGEELPRGAVLSWFREQVLEGLGLEEPPLSAVQGPDKDAAQPEMRRMHMRVPGTSRAVRVNRQTGSDQDTSQIILFSSSGEKLFVFVFFLSSYLSPKFTSMAQKSSIFTSRYIENNALIRYISYSFVSNVCFILLALSNSTYQCWLCVKVVCRVSYLNICESNSKQTHPGLCSAGLKRIQQEIFS